MSHRCTHRHRSVAVTNPMMVYHPTMENKLAIDSTSLRALRSAAWVTLALLMGLTGCASSMNRAAPQATNSAKEIKVAAVLTPPAPALAQAAEFNGVLPHVSQRNPSVLAQFSAAKAEAARSSAARTESRRDSTMSRADALAKHAEQLAELRRLPHVDSEVIARYKTFLTRPLPRAFAVGENGGWWAAFGVSSNPEVRSDVRDRALDGCEERTKARCVLFAVDRQVVYEPQIVAVPPK